MRIRRKISFEPFGAPPSCQPEAPPSLSVSLYPSPSVYHHHPTAGNMSSSSQTKSLSPEGETFDSSQIPEIQPLSRHLDAVPSNSEPHPSPLPLDHELVLVAPDIPLDAPALGVAPLTEKPQRRASRRRADWTPPEGLQMIVQERKSGRSKGNKDTYYTLPGVSTKFRSIPEIQRYLKNKPIRIWRKLSQKSRTQSSTPTEVGSSSKPSDPQQATESCPEEPKREMKDGEQAERPKSRPKVCVQKDLFKRFRRHKHKKS